MKIKPTSLRNSGFRRSRSRGMSGFEMLLLLVVAYVAVSAGINWLKDAQQQRLTDAKVREIAQRVVTVAETAERAGVDLTVGSDVKATVDLIARGGVAKYGAFQGQFFGMPELKGKAKERVARHLEFHYDRLAVTKFQSFASAD